MSENIVEKVLKQQKELDLAKKEAIKELLRQRKEIESQLAELGYEVMPTSVGKPARRKTTGKKQTRQLAADTVCKVCKFTTAPPHDSRKHRSQGEKQKPFNEEELKELGLKKKA